MWKEPDNKIPEGPGSNPPKHKKLFASDQCIELPHDEIGLGGCLQPQKWALTPCGSQNPLSPSNWLQEATNIPAQFTCLDLRCGCTALMQFTITGSSAHSVPGSTMSWCVSLLFTCHCVNIIMSSCVYTSCLAVSICVLLWPAISAAVSQRSSLQQNTPIPQPITKSCAPIC